MTGYARARHGATPAGAESGARVAPARRLGLEIRSVNARFLVIALPSPDELRAAEPLLRSLLTTRLKRGKVEVRVALDNEDSHHLQDPQPKLLQRLNSLQDSVLAWLPGAPPLSAARGLRLCATPQTGSEDGSQAIAALAEQALDALMAAREREGQRLVGALLERLWQLRKLTQQAAPMVPALVEQ